MFVKDIRVIRLNFSLSKSSINLVKNYCFDIIRVKTNKA